MGYILLVITVVGIVVIWRSCNNRDLTRDETAEYLANQYSTLPVDWKIEFKKGGE